MLCTQYIVVHEHHPS